MGGADLQAARLIVPQWIRKEDKAERILALAKENEIPIVYVRRGDVITDGDTKLTVKSPAGKDGLIGNAASLVLLLQYRTFDALLTGDLEEEGEEKILPYLSDVDVLKVAHHGSAHSTGTAFLKKTQPELCLISAPRRSIYGHPHRETIARIEESGADWYQTGLRGALRVTVGGGKMQMDCFYPEDRLY